MPKSNFLIDLEDINRKELRDPITLRLWLKKAEEHIKNMELSKLSPTPSKPLDSIVIEKPSTPIALKETKEDILRKEVERTLLATIDPEDWQVNTLLMTLKTFIGWKDKKQRSIIAEYESSIAKAIHSLRRRRAEIRENEDINLVNTFLTEAPED